jgi:hypothetical protein
MSLHENLRYVFPLPTDWEWVGLYQDTQTDTIEFIFAAIEQAVSTKWKKVSDLPSLRERKYVELSAKKDGKIWVLIQEDFSD